MQMRCYPPLSPSFVQPRATTHAQHSQMRSDRELLSPTRRTPRYLTKENLVIPHFACFVQYGIQGPVRHLTSIQEQNQLCPPLPPDISPMLYSPRSGIRMSRLKATDEMKRTRSPVRTYRGCRDRVPRTVRPYRGMKEERFTAPPSFPWSNSVES
jgi:hypothetical protein